jgi:hypothetical protein
MITIFERDCSLIKLYFANHPQLEARRCVKKISSWSKVYLVEFYWGKTTFFSKKSPILGNLNIQSEVGKIREYSDPIALKLDHPHQKWTKQQHEKWLKMRELQVRYYWASKEYANLNESPELIEVMAAFYVLELKPFAVTFDVKKAFRKLSLQFHPDRGGDEDSFRFLQEMYQKALLYANDYLTTNKLEVF